MNNLLKSMVIFAAGAASVSAVFAQSETAKRLSRVSAHLPNGKHNLDATIGNLTIDSFGHTYRKYVAGKELTVAEYAVKMRLCDMPGNRDIASIFVKDALKRYSKSDKTLLKAQDTKLINKLAMQVIASLDDISPKLIEDDERIGPGVYHDAVAGMENALKVCRFYGQLR